MIILVRHAQSEGNKNREIHQMVPDHRVKLTAEGHRQAREAGHKLRSLLRPDDTLHFFTSPYRRTRETTEGILESVSSDSPSPSPFPRHTIKVYEEPRLREQDFGNFQPCSAEMERMWLERADYGHFFYRIPNGESAADAYDRVSGFNESLWRLFGDDDFASVCVLVTHGLMARVFLTKWYHWSVEYFEDLRNINHCEFVIMKLRDNGKYALDNQLRTWSELKREQEEERQRQRAAKGLDPTSPSELTIPIRRKWGGCPEGCNHGIRRRGSKRSTRQNQTESLRRDSDTAKKINESNAQDSKNATNDPQQLTASEPGVGDKTPPAMASDQQTTATPGDAQSYISLDSLAQPSSQSTPIVSDNNEDTRQVNKQKTHRLTPTAIDPVCKRPNLSHFHRDSDDHLLHPPRTNLAFLQLAGRDGGGSLSGANSVAASEDEHEDNARSLCPRQTLRAKKPSHDIEHDGDDEASGPGTQKLRRARSHRHRTNHLELPKQYNEKNHESSPGDRGGSEGIKDDIDDIVLDLSVPINGHGKENQTEAEEDLEARRRYDQSIRGSVY